MNPEIDPFPDRVARPNAIIDGEYWSSRHADAVVLVLPKPLAGDGTRRQLQGVAEGLNDLRVPCFYLGSPIHEGPSFLARPTIEVPPTQDVPATYEAISTAISGFFSNPEHRSFSSILFLSMGYTAFFPEALRRSIHVRGEFEGRAICCILDSAFPDTDNEDLRLSTGGWPMCRFFPSAYAASDKITTMFLLTSSYAYDARVLEARLPQGLSGVGVVAPPYTNRYVNRIRQISDNAERFTETVSSLVPAMNSYRKGDLLIPVVSSDIWSDDAVGNWMTRDQHETCEIGIRKIVTALERVARRLDRRIFVPMHVRGARFLSSVVPQEITVKFDEGPGDSGAHLIVAGYDHVPQDSHSRLLACSELAICRTAGQSNASVVLALCRTPIFVMDMPARGYMQSEITSACLLKEPSIDTSGSVTARDREVPLGWRVSWQDSIDDLTHSLLHALQDRAERARRTEAAYKEFESLFSSENGNVLRIVKSVLS